MIWSIAWKNIWRSKIRSLVVIFAVMIGIFSAVMMVGIMQGWINQRVHDALHNEISHVQIHNPKFMLNEDIHLTIPDYQKAIDTIKNTPGVKAYSSRVKIFALAQSDWASTGFSLNGINPKEEENVTDIHDKIILGDYFKEEEGLPSIVIGNKIAENLRLLNYEVSDEKVNQLDNKKFKQDIKDSLMNLKGTRYRTEKDFKLALEQALPKPEFKKEADYLIKYFSFYRLRAKITVTTQNLKGDLVLLAFRVKGIYKTTDGMFNGTAAFVNEDVLKKELGLGKNDFHEIAILSDNEEKGVELADILKAKLPGYSVMSWKEISPELSYYSEFMNLMDYIFICIFLLALSFGIINTMLMSVLERVKELGMLMAVGMNKKRVFSMIMLESIFLTLTGAIVGMILSNIAVTSLGHTGINLSMWAEGLEAIGYASIIYPYVPFNIFIGVTLLVILTGILSSIWPARKALRLNPVEALRTE